MTITEIGDFVKSTAVRRLDRGGSVMNLISELLFSLDYNDNQKRNKIKINDSVDDYGYRLYQTLEYDFRYLKNDDLVFRGNSLNTIKK